VVLDDLFYRDSGRLDLLSELVAIALADRDRSGSNKLVFVQGVIENTRRSRIATLSLPDDVERDVLIMIVVEGSYGELDYYTTKKSNAERETNLRVAWIEPTWIEENEGGEVMVSVSGSVDQREGLRRALKVAVSGVVDVA